MIKGKFLDNIGLSRHNRIKPINYETENLQDTSLFKSDFEDPKPENEVPGKSLKLDKA